MLKFSVFQILWFLINLVILLVSFTILNPKHVLRSLMPRHVLWIPSNPCMNGWIHPLSCSDNTFCCMRWWFHYSNAMPFIQSASQPAPAQTTMNKKTKKKSIIAITCHVWFLATSIHSVEYLFVFSNCWNGFMFSSAFMWPESVICGGLLYYCFAVWRYGAV